MNDYMAEARKVASEWYADERHNTQMTGYAMELLVEAIANALKILETPDKKESNG